MTKTYPLPCRLPRDSLVLNITVHFPTIDLPIKFLIDVVLLTPLMNPRASLIADAYTFNLRWCVVTVI